MAHSTCDDAGPRELDAFRAGSQLDEDLADLALTAAERLRLHPALWLAPFYVVLVGCLALLTDGADWRGDDISVLAVVTLVAGEVGALHVFSALMLSSDFMLRDRRRRVVLRRSIRAGRPSWTTADGELVRVYAIKPRARFLRAPDAEVLGAREFHAERDVDMAHAYVAELERMSRPDPVATALARVLNDPARDTIRADSA